MEANVAELVAFLAETLKQGVSFAQEQLPVWVDQILRYGLVSSIFTVIVAVLILAACGIALHKVFDAAKEEGISVWDFGVGFFVALICPVLIAIFTVVLVGELLDIIKILTAPSLYLLQIVQSL